VPQSLTEEKLDVTGAILERTPRKSLKRVVEETGVSKSSARRATQLPKLRPYKTTVIHALEPRNTASRVAFFQLVSTVCRSAVDILF
jgi:hypothetical protein